MRFKVDL